jgi:hypothetical protein
MLLPTTLPRAPRGRPLVGGARGHRKLRCARAERHDREADDERRDPERQREPRPPADERLGTQDQQGRPGHELHDRQPGHRAAAAPGHRAPATARPRPARRGSPYAPSRDRSARPPSRPCGGTRPLTRGRARPGCGCRCRCIRETPGFRRSCPGTRAPCPGGRSARRSARRSRRSAGHVGPRTPGPGRRPARTPSGRDAPVDPVHPEPGDQAINLTQARVEPRLVLVHRREERVGIPGVPGRLRRQPRHIGESKCSASPRMPAAESPRPWTRMTVSRAAAGGGPRRSTGWSA